MLLAGCTLFGIQAPAATVCAAERSTYEGVAVAAFDTSVGAVRALEPFAATPRRWPDRPDDYPAILCYVDGRVAMAPPGGDPFDRAVVAVVDARPTLIAAGYRRDLPIRSP